MFGPGFFPLVGGIGGPELFFKQVRGTGRKNFHLVSSQSDDVGPSYDRKTENKTVFFYPFMGLLGNSSESLPKFLSKTSPKLSKNLP